MSRGKVIIIQGGQYGSEGKGQIAAVVAGRRDVYFAVRTGSINAGHTVYHGDRKFAMQIVPTPWVHPQIQLVLGAGCYIEPSILRAEVEAIQRRTGEDIRKRLFIDHRCVWFGDAEKEKSQAANRHHAMGATGKGCSEAIVSKMRDRGTDHPEERLFKNHPEAAGYVFTDTAEMLSAALKQGRNVLLEGTQGALLDFNTGPYPFVTSRMTSSAAWLAEAGLPPVNVETVLVVRAYPIRVAGNSGPMPGEISWPILAREINRKLARRALPPLVDPKAIQEFDLALDEVLQSQYPELVHEVGLAAAHEMHTWPEELRQRYRVCLSEANTSALKLLSPETIEALKFFEKTTVTKKLRRIARLDLGEVRRAINQNGPTCIAYTFLNYDAPELANETNLSAVLFNDETSRFIDDLERTLGVPVRYVTTGPLNEHVIDLHG